MFIIHLNFYEMANESIAIHGRGLGTDGLVKINKQYIINWHQIW